MPFSERESYEAREKRIDDAVRLQRPDRVPVVPLITHYFPTRAAGMSNKDARFLHERRFEILKELTLRLKWDGALTSGALISAKSWEILGSTQFKWPGGELGEDAPFQFVGTEVMKGEEYDEFLGNPDSFTLRKILPRISKVFAPLADIPLPPAHWFLNGYNFSLVLPAVVSIPPITNLLERLVQAGREVAKYNALERQYVSEMRSLGYPIPYGGVTITAFDWVADFLRGIRGGLTDMIRDPERLLAAIELLLPATIQNGILSAKQVGNKRVFIPLHFGSAGFMSNKQYARFYWPTFKKLLLALIDAGLTPIPLFEGDYTPRLEFLTELPKGKVAGHFDIVDRKRAKEIIGNSICFWGNVPSSLLATGTPKQVKEDVRELIDLFGDNGGVIIDGSGGIPDEAKPENVAAMVEEVFEYGIY